MGVDVALGILHDAVRVAPPDAGGQFTPVVDRLVGIGASAEHRPLGSCLVLCTKDDRGQNRRRRGGCEKFASGAFHRFAFYAKRSRIGLPLPSRVTYTGRRSTMYEVSGGMPSA